MSATVGHPLYLDNTSGLIPQTSHQPRQLRTPGKCKVEFIHFARDGEVGKPLLHYNPYGANTS